MGNERDLPANPEFMGEHGFDLQDEGSAQWRIKTWGERFEDCGEIGAGGMGAVHEVFDRELGRHIAVKVMHHVSLDGSRETEAFVSEARLMGRLDHPYIVPVHDLASKEARPHFAMKLVEGVNLGAWMRANAANGLTGGVLDQALGILLKVCDAVAFAHSRGVLHLDLKPPNVMVGEHGQIYVMDWGVAVECVRDQHGHLRPREGTRGIRGTPGYMAPELVDDKLSRVDERSDVYGLGAILYELLTGKTPFEPTGAPVDLVFMREHHVPPPQEVAPNHVMPPGLCAIALKALAHDMQERYADVMSLRMALEGFRRGGGWFETRSYNAGDVIIREGDRGDEGFILTSGRCSVEQGQGDARAVLGVLETGQVFGEAAVLSGSVRTATVIALEPVTVMVVTRDAIDHELDGRGWLAAFIRTIAERYVKADAERAALRAKLRSMASEPPPRPSVT